MAFCNKCGKQIPEGAAFCPSCGNRMETAAPGGAGNYNTAPQPPRVVPPVNGPADPQPGMGYTAPQTQPMNYYKFVIWVQMFLAVLVGVVQGLGMLFGFWYDMTAQISAQWFYMFYPAMHIVDVLFGLAYLALAAGAFYTRQQLAQFRKNGPDLYYLFIIAGTVLGFLYTVLQGIVCATAAGLLSAIVQAAAKVVLLVLCRIYFEKRRHLFCN